MPTVPQPFRRLRFDWSISLVALVAIIAVASVLSIVQGQQALADTPDTPPAGAPETSFDFAVVPDTQEEVMVDGAPLLTGRYQWLSDNKDALNLKFIEQIGDLVNWGVVDPIQFTRASLATNILDNSGIPYGYTIGNHDGAAVNSVGSAAPGNVRNNLRNTTVFNEFFPVSRFKNVQGTFEPNKVDNMYQTFAAGGVDWLVISHEMWPRESVIQWMKGVVASHPSYNVIVSTHAYADQTGNLPTSGNYGDQNALVEWQEFISQYANIKFVISGHYGAYSVPLVNGGYSYSEQTGINGNKVAQIMTAYHSDYQNQVRLLHIDTVTGSISSSVYVNNSTNAAYPTGYVTDEASNFVTTGMNWIRPDGSGTTPVLSVPSAPTAVSAVAGNGSATVSFAMPTTLGGASITGYIVTSTPGNVVVTGGVSPIKVNGLTNGIAYTFSAQATNSVGTSLPSANSNSVTPQVPSPSLELLADPGFEAVGNGGWVAFVVGNLSTVASPVHGGLKALKVAAMASTYNFVGLTQNTVISNSVSGRQYTAQCWVNPTSAGLNIQMRFLQYTQNYSANTNLNSTLINNLPANIWTLVKVTGTATKNGYRVIPQIYSSNQTTNTGSIIYDDCSVAAIGDVPASAPGAPTSVAAAAGDGKAIVSFTTPASNGGSPITGYTVTSSPGNITTAGTGSPVTVDGLTNGVTYTFVVRAINSVGTSPPSSASTSVTPVVPGSVPTEPLGVGAVAGNASAIVSFSPPASDGGALITSYTVISSLGSFTATGAGSPVTVSGLTNGTTYTFTVKANNGVGSGAPSAASNAVVPVAPLTSPSAPFGVTADSGDGQATISFAVPASNGGSPITGYVVTSSPGGIVVAAGASPIIVAGLTNGTPYTFTVQAVNGIGTSPPSGASSSVIPDVPVMFPGAPLFVSAVASGGKAVVSFLPPAPNGSTTIISYTVTSTPGNISVTGSGSPITVPGLNVGTSYTFNVKANNISGSGALSGASNAVIPFVELLADPGFEAVGNGGWVAFVVGNLSTVASPVHGGLKALKVAAMASTYNFVGLTQNTVISNSVSGRQYTAQCWVNPTSAGLNIQMRFLQYTQNYSANTNLNSTLINNLPANIWTLVKVTGTATKNGYRVIPQIYSSNQTTNTGSIIYDDCSVY